MLSSVHVNSLDSTPTLQAVQAHHSCKLQGARKTFGHDLVSLLTASQALDLSRQIRQTEHATGWRGK